jgi:hypothetical protein
MRRGSRDTEAQWCVDMNVQVLAGADELSSNLMMLAMS